MKRTFEDCFGGEEEEVDVGLLEVEDWNAPVIPDDDLFEDDENKKKRPKQKMASRQDKNNEHCRTVVHIDLDCFYAQVEMIRNPTLRDKPLGIQQKNILVTSNYVARACGVGKLSYVKEALQKCPDLVLVSGEDLTHYRETSYKVTDLLHQFSRLVERLGFDENYIDVSHLVEERLKNTSLPSSTTVGGQGEKMLVSGHVYHRERSFPACLCGCHQRLAIGSHIAMEMRQQLYNVLGLTSCAGVAHNKLLAKLVGEQNKPNDQTTIFPGNAEYLMLNLGKVRKIPGVGHSTGKRLASMGITTIQHLHNASQPVLESTFGHQQASTMQQLSHGVDNTPVTPTGAPQSISDEDSFKKCSTLSDAKQRMVGMLENLLKRLKSDGRVPQTIRVTIRKYSPNTWKRESRQCSLSLATLKDIDKDEDVVLPKLLDTCVGLLNKMVDTTKPFHLTLINICFAKMQENSKKASYSIENFFTPKATSAFSRTKQSHSEVTSSLASREDPVVISSSSTQQTRGYDESPNVKESLSFNKHSPDVKEKGGTLDAFFSYPKRNRDDASSQNVKVPLGFNNKHSPDVREKLGTLDAFFSSPKRNRTETSSFRKYKQSDNVNLLHSNEAKSNKSKQNPIEKGQLSANSSPYYKYEDTSESPMLPEVNTSATGVGTVVMNKDLHSDKCLLHEPSPASSCHTFECRRIPESPMQLGVATGSSFATGEIVPLGSIATNKDLLKEQSDNPFCSSLNLPSNVDPEVFAQLPSELQQELSVEFAASLPVRTCLDGDGETMTRQPHKQSNVDGSLTTLSCQPANKRSTESHKHSCINDPPTILPGQPNIIATECQYDKANHALSLQMRKTSQQKITKQSDSIEASSNLLPVVPPHVDAEVFGGLPYELQQELTKEWRRNTSSRREGVGHTSKGQRERHKAKNISDYFRK